MTSNKKWLVGIYCNVVAFLLAAAIAFSGATASSADVDVHHSPKYLQLAYLASAGPAIKWSLVRTAWLANIRLLALIVAGTITLGFVAIVQIVANGAKIGILFVAQPEALRGLILMGILPHGLLEYFAFFAAGGRSIEALLLFVDYMRGKTVNLLNFIWSLGLTALMSVVLLTAAAFVEAFITPRLVLLLYGN